MWPVQAQETKQTYIYSCSFSFFFLIWKVLFDNSITHFCLFFCLLRKKCCCTDHRFVFFMTQNIVHTIGQIKHKRPPYFETFFYPCSAQQPFVYFSWQDNKQTLCVFFTERILPLNTKCPFNLLIIAATGPINMQHLSQTGTAIWQNGLTYLYLRANTWQIIVLKLRCWVASQVGPTLLRTPGSSHLILQVCVIGRCWWLWSQEIRHTSRKVLFTRKTFYQLVHNFQV